MVEFDINKWAEDPRIILCVKLAANGNRYDIRSGDRIERFERPGEYCMLPWIRVHAARGHLGTIEAPLTQVESIEYQG